MSEVTTTAHGLPAGIMANFVTATARGLNWAMLTRAEQETFAAGLRTRMRARLFPAIQAVTAHDYRERRDDSLHPFWQLMSVHEQELRGTAEPVTEEDTLTALDAIEETLGESRRHQVEHDLNVGRAALVIFARAEEGTSDLEPGFASTCGLRWALGWMVVNWALNCIAVIADEQESVQTDVLDAIFTDLHGAVTELYQVASEVYDVCCGNPDDDEDDDAQPAPSAH